MRAEMRLCVNVGSVVEDDDQIGLAHFVEHMAFNGSEHFPKQDLINFMESIGMRLGPGVNANTGFDETVYMLHVPTDNPEAMNKAFLFLADVAHNLSFDPDGHRQGARRHHRGMAAGARRGRQDAGPAVPDPAEGLALRRAGADRHQGEHRDASSPRR